MWKSVLITVKGEIGGAAAQIELKEVADKGRLDLVVITVFQIRRKSLVQGYCIVTVQVPCKTMTLNSLFLLFFGSLPRSHYLARSNFVGRS